MRHALARRLYQFPNPGDVLLGDRAFCAYADLVFVKSRQADAVFRKHQGRFQKMRRGKIIGSHDLQIIWNKPKTCPKGLTLEEFTSLPKTLTVREVHALHCHPRFSDITGFFNHYSIRY